MRFVFFVGLCFYGLSVRGSSPEGLNRNKYLERNKEFSKEVLKLNYQLDSDVRRDSLKKDSLQYLEFAIDRDRNSVILSDRINKFPGVSLQQYLKGQAAGVYIQEPSGEPGTEQNIFIRGISKPILSAKDISENEPLVVINGVPVLSKDHPFAYGIQQYDFNRIGTSTNILSTIDPDNIESIEVIKDSRSAIYGPRASNGVILITTKQASLKKEIFFNSYIGVAAQNSIETINGASENNFRKQFYNRYANFEQTQNGPAYLRDSLYNIYYGPSNWTDLYYKNALVYGINASVTGGSDRSNFRVSLGSQSNNGIADHTGLDRYSASFVMTMKPLTWLSVTTSINANQLVRDRNKNLRDRFAEIRYFPNLSNPISPNKDYYSNYLDEYDKSFDSNKNNVLNGYVNLGIDFKRFKFNSRLAVDYNEGYRDVFYPSTLLETNSYVSNYFGYSQRLYAENSLSYQTALPSLHKLNLEIGQSLNYDTYRYSYGYAYKGVSDYIKINLLDDPKSPTAGYFSYSANNGFLNTLTWRFIDGITNNLVSFHGKADYSFDDKYSLFVLLRTDGSSTAQPTNRWFFSPAVSASWNLKNEFLKDNSLFNNLKFTAGYSRLGKLEIDDKFAAGPYYTVDLSYTGEPRAGTYSGSTALNRPYSTGWVGYNLPWAYTELVNVNLQTSLFNNRLHAILDVYSKSDKDQIIAVPQFAEYGYERSYESGMNVNNSGIDLTISANVLGSKKSLNWNTNFNINYNKNILKALPKGVERLVFGDRLLQVGKGIDQYWLLENNGIYTSDAQIPVNPLTGEKLSFGGVPLNPGDPIWTDRNGDNIINDDDKILKGRMLPVISGGFNNNFSYKGYTLGLNFYYNLGREILNQDMANRFDFINNQNANDINSVKEITFWEKRGNYNQYPIYNPWSDATPYRKDQDLFLENGSFLKLRSFSLSYDVLPLIKNKNLKINKFSVYVTANNLFTLTPYSGRDPELVNYAGYDTGYGHYFARTYTMGVKLGL